MSTPLAIYLSDHYTGATAGVELARRLAKNHRDQRAGAPLRELAAEVADDRVALRRLMAQLDVRPARYRRIGGWIGEKAARLKLNGRLIRRAPLSSVIELEAMLLAVEGKAAGWRLLHDLADRIDGLAPDTLDRLEQRAVRQAETLERLRREAAADVFTETHR
ncbi:hypothetical protein [Nocardia aurantia]|uniref:Uncharacterized protein n=1 Tax=Nocardia aurantia TaxID=2585199 RepID=A0A7K0DTB2_9NOCA|nr:hypothetical protein [Nocardia aurantia]MQY28818.1 hypothetical protein [Nocardia aurantia]